MYPFLLKKKDASTCNALMRCIIWSTYTGNTILVLVNLSREIKDMSNFVAWSKTMPSCNVSEQYISLDAITEAAKPDGDNEFFHKKLPYSNVADVADDTDQSIPSASSRLFNITCAINVFVHLKNSDASASYSCWVTSLTLVATNIIL